MMNMIYSLINTAGVGLLIALLIVTHQRGKSVLGPRRKALGKIRFALSLFLFATLLQSIRPFAETLATSKIISDVWIIAQGISVPLVLVGLVVALVGAARWETLGLEITRQKEIHTRRTHELEQTRRMAELRERRVQGSSTEVAAPVNSPLNTEAAALRLAQAQKSIEALELPTERFSELFKSLESELERGYSVGFLLLELSCPNSETQTLKRRESGGSLVRHFYPATRSLALDDRLNPSSSSRVTRGGKLTLPVVDTRDSSFQIAGYGLKEAIYTVRELVDGSRLLCFVGNRANGSFDDNRVSELIALAEALPLESLTAKEVTAPRGSKRSKNKSRRRKRRSRLPVTPLVAIDSEPIRVIQKPESLAGLPVEAENVE